METRNKYIWKSLETFNNEKKIFFFPFCIIKLEEKKKSLINWFKEEEKKTAYIIRSKVETNIKKKKNTLRYN